MTRDPMSSPTPADLLILADIAEILEDPDLAAEWRAIAYKAMQPVALRVELRRRPALASALVAELSVRLGSLDAAYELLGSAAPGAEPDDGERPGGLVDPDDYRDPGRWAR